MESDRILKAQGGILVEVESGATFRVGEDGLLHFRVRNLTERSGRLTMCLKVARAELHQAESTITLLPGGVQDLRFGVTADMAGEKLVEGLDVRFELGEGPRRLTLPDHSLTFHMARPGDDAGRLDLRGATFDFRDHVGDVSIQQLIESQDRSLAGRDQGDWHALALASKPVDGTALVIAPRQTGLRGLLLVAKGRGKGEDLKVFLLARGVLDFGNISRVGDDEIPLVLRLLPISDRPRDADNLHRTRLISRLHGRIGLHEQALCLRDESSNGTKIDGRPVTKGSWETLPRDFQMDLTARDHALSLEGRIFYPGVIRHAIALGWTCHEDRGESLEVGAEHVLPLNALRLRRLGNAENHVYYQVFRSVSVGAGPRAALRIEDRGLLPRHAEIVFYRAEWFVRRINPDAVVEVNGYPPRREEYVSLAPGKTLTLGAVHFQLRSAGADEMSSL